MAVSFTRQLGYEPGVQLNPTIDKSEGFATDAVENQTFAAVARLPRGYIDRAFRVAKSDVQIITGTPEPVRKNALNASHSQLIEALSKGAKNVVVSRLVGADAKNQWITVSARDGELQFNLQDEPEGEFLFAIRHKGCFSDGIKLSVSAREVRDISDLPVSAKEITLKIMDRSGTMLHGFTGSLDLDNLDDNGIPHNLQSIIENYSSEDYDFVLAANATIPTTSKAYGKDVNGLQKSFVTPVLYPFSEGDVSSVTATQYKDAVKRLEDTTLDFVYISSLGTESTTLISELQQLAFNRNIQLGVDIPNHLTPKQAIAWRNQTGITSHLTWFVWHPVECIDPSGVSGKVKIGTSALRCAYSCLRNAAINRLGFAKKEYAISGREFPIQRTGMKQLYRPKQDELSDLAKAGITPVIYQTFSGGGLFIFDDAVTASGKMSSYLNLINSVEIATTLERDIARMAKESFMYGPMEVAVKLAQRMTKEHLEHAETSGWLVKSDELDGNAFIIRIYPNAQRPADVMMIDLRMRVEGCVRQVHITNEITR